MITHPGQIYLAELQPLAGDHLLGTSTFSDVAAFSSRHPALPAAMPSASPDQDRPHYKTLAVHGGQAMQTDTSRTNAIFNTCVRGILY
jgi:hypothetical protein